MKKTFTFLVLSLFTFTLFAQEDFIRSAYQNAFINTFTLADFDGDGDIDIFGIDHKFSTPSDLYVFLNHGISPIGFDKTEIAGDYGAMGSPEAGDYDGDGDMDVILAKGDDLDLYVLQNDGTGTFESIPLNISGAQVFQLHDLEDDGDMDIIGMDPNQNTLNIFINDGNQNYTVVNILDSDRDLVAFDADDLDEDGDIDIVIGYDAYNGDQLVIYKNNGNNSFETVVLASEDFDGVNAISIEDLNNDGQKDVTSTSKYRLEGWINQGGFLFERNILVSSETITGYRSLTFADYNGDGSLDAVLGDSDGIKWYKNVSTSPLEYEQGAVGGTSTVWSFANADFDLDGDIDILTSNGDLWWYENNIEQVATSFLEQQGFEISIFPNPVQETIHLDLSNFIQEGKGVFYITNNTGHIVKSGIIQSLKNKNNTQVDISNLPKGHYFFNIKTPLGISTGKSFIKGK